MAKAMAVYQLKITLARISPPIWRRVQVRDCSLAKLHDVIQTAFGWMNAHLWSFNVRGVEFSDDDTGELDMADAREALLSSFVDAGVKKFRYTYDFGDTWEHVIEVQKVLTVEPGAHYPRCLAGKRACPPEDCGGSWGYVDLLDAIKHPEKDPERLEWLGGEFDPEEFNLERVNKMLAKR